MDVSVVIPTYNERATITDTLRAVDTALEGEDREILVVDDGSPDGTADMARGMQDEIAGLRVVERKRKEGLGAAYKDAFDRVEGDIVVQMDADGSHPPEAIPQLIDAVRKGADVAVGSRYVAGGDRKDPLHRRIFPLIGSHLYQYVLGFPVRDVTSGMKAYSREALDTVRDAEGLPDGFHSQAASLHRLVQAGYTVTEVPITFRERQGGNPKYGPRDLLDNLGLFVRLALSRENQMLRYMTVGGAGAVLNMAILFLLTEFAGLYYLVSAGIAVETGILTTFVLHDYWTFPDHGEAASRATMERLGKYHTVALVGGGVNWVLLAVFTEVFGIYYLFANGLAILGAFLWNYTGNLLWTWSGTGQDTTHTAAPGQEAS